MYPHTEAYLNLRRSTDIFEEALHPPKENIQYSNISNTPIQVPQVVEPFVDWESVKFRLQDEARPQYHLSLDAAPVRQVQLEGENSGAGSVILVMGRIEKTEPDHEESEVPEWLLDWRLFFYQENTKSYIEVEGSQYELSLLPDIPDPMKEFQYFLILKPSLSPYIPQEAMINFYLDMNVRSSNDEHAMQAGASFPVQREWLNSCWANVPLLPPSIETPQLELQIPSEHPSVPPSTPAKKPTKPRKRRRPGNPEGRTRAPPSKKKRDLSEDVQKEMDKLFEEAKNLKQRKAVYSQLPNEPPPDILTENNEMKFQCPLCKKVYGRKDSCRKHIASELWEYPCSYCGIISATAQACMYHIMAKHLHMQVFDCPHCDKRFATHYALSNHQERSHPSDRNEKKEEEIKE